MGTPKMSTTETFWGEEQPTDSGTACANSAQVVLFRESCDEVEGSDGGLLDFVLIICFTVKVPYHYLPNRSESYIL